MSPSSFPPFRPAPVTDAGFLRKRKRLIRIDQPQYPIRLTILQKFQSRKPIQPGLNKLIPIMLQTFLAGIIAIATFQNLPGFVQEFLGHDTHLSRITGAAGQTIIQIHIHTDVILIM